MILGEKEAVKYKDKYKLWEVKKAVIDSIAAFYIIIRNNIILL